MVRKSFLKSLNDEELTLLDKLEDIIFYNDAVIFIRHIARFLKRLPIWIKLCWNTESWNYESIYDILEMELKDMKKAQDVDTWHIPHEVKRRSQQIALVLAHLDRFRNPFDYFDYPESKMVRTDHEYNGQPTYTLKFIDEDGEERFKKFHDLEVKHYEKFWKLLKKWHRGWWT